MATASTNGKGKEPTTADLADQIDVLKKEIGALTETFGDYGKARAAELKEEAESRAEALREKAADLKSRGEDQVALLGEETQEFLARQPATALGIAAGIGFFVGLLYTRR